MNQHPADSSHITRLSASDLARSIAAGELSAAEVTDAHIRRIQAVNPRLNAVVVPLFEQARQHAAQADQKRRSGSPVGPLHGVPVTIKECFQVAGTPTTIGIGRLRDQTSPQDGILVRRLRHAGAIVLGKTNVPQLMLMHESDNPVYGRTNNPWSDERGPGGSSGGEAAIVAAGGAPLGLGNDLGGSIRQPAHSCGIHGLMPTAGRLTNSGSLNVISGMQALGLQSGPLARSVADLELALRVLAEGEPREPDLHVPPAPLLSSADVRTAEMRIGLFTNDGFFPACPAVRRAVEESASALRSLGAHVEEFSPPEVPHAVELYLGLFSADGGAAFRRMLGRSRRDPRIQKLVRLARVPHLLRGVLVGCLRGCGQRRLAHLVEFTGLATAEAYWSLTEQRTAYVNRFSAMLEARRLDALVFPPHALPALRHGTGSKLIPAASYCYLPNLLGMPAGVVAATRVQSGEESDRAASRDRVERAAIRVEEGSAGLPIGVQVMARHWREDIVLAVMATLESFFRSRPDYPSNPPI